MDSLTADVLVLGAGISGLSCAAALRNAGLRVVVLEARNRMGGRLHTVRLPDPHGRPGWAVDLGGAWVHGIGSSAAPNELYALARQCELNCRHTDYSDAVVYTADGVRLEDGIIADIEHLYHSFEEHLRALLAAPDPRLALLPIQTALDSFAASRRLSPRQRAHLAFAVSNHIEHYWAGEARRMGVAALDEEVLPGGDVVAAEGLGSVVAPLAAGLDVRLRHEVTAVQYGVPYGSGRSGRGGGGGGVVVTARVGGGEDGGAGNVVAGGGGGALVRYAARAAVVTLPLGVLRSRCVAFEPPLERSDPGKAAAIAGLGTAVYNKVIMVFDPSDVFWDSTAFIYRIPGAEEAGRWSWFLNLHKVTGAPILIAFNMGEAAAALEAVGDEEAVGGALAALGRLYGPARVRRPRHAVVTRWGSDPHSRMSYTYIPAGVTSAAFDDLARPVPGGLYFAGEATHRRHYGTAHGAFASGRAAAAAILQELQLQKQPYRFLGQAQPWDRPMGRSPWSAPVPVRLPVFAEEACRVGGFAGGVGGPGVYAGVGVGMGSGMALALVPTGGVQVPAREGPAGEDAADMSGLELACRDAEAVAEVASGLKASSNESAYASEVDVALRAKL